MKNALVLLPLAVLLSYCGTPRSTHAGSGSPTQRAMRHNASASASSDSLEAITVSGTQYVPIEGRNEFGVRPDLEGTWVLSAMPGTPADGRTNTNNITTNKSLAGSSETGTEFSGNAMSERMKNSTEVKRDSVTTKSKDGTTHTSTTVYLLNKEDGQGNKITPPQSSNPNVHIPEPPSLRFYGSNETFSGFTGCNKISGRYMMTGRNSISFHDAAPSTKMVCIGEWDEEAFLSKLKRVDSFKSTGGQLQLMEGTTVLLTFSKK